MTKAEHMLTWYCDRFEREYRDAQCEFTRLSQLFTDVCWYNHEVACREWQDPWRPSFPLSEIELQGMTFKRKWCRGKLIEHGHFPVWYRGTVADAPVLPPHIVWRELREAEAYMRACETQMRAPYEWAPGGVLYKNLAHQTLIGRAPPTSRCVYAPHSSC